MIEDININKIYISPIKLQGKKSKLIPYIREYYRPSSLYIESFMGSGIVGFNLKPKIGIFSDINPHVINLYNSIKDKKITSVIVREYLQKEGEILKRYDSEYYLEVRKRFNEKHDSLDFLFLNRSCFNGIMRFNKKGEFNTPYCHKPDRFSKAYITRITNQVKYLEDCLSIYDWSFQCEDYTVLLNLYKDDSDSFFYIDPPYIDRYNDYYGNWNETNEYKLNSLLKELKGKFLLSTWSHNKYRKNEYLNDLYKDYNIVTKEHFYYVGGKEVNRNSVVEVLVMNYQ